MRVARMMTSVRMGVTRTSTPVAARLRLPLCSTAPQAALALGSASQARTAVAVLSQLPRQQLVQLSIEDAVRDELQPGHTRWRAAIPAT